MDIIKESLKDLNLSIQKDKFGLITDATNNNNLPFKIVVRKTNDHDIYKVYFTDNRKFYDKKVYNLLEDLNKNISLGHFYYINKENEIRFNITINIDYSIECFNYIKLIIKYGMIIYSEYYMEYIYPNKLSYRYIDTFEDNIKLYNLFINIQCIEYTYEGNLTYSKDTLLMIINALNMKSNYAEGILKDNKLIIRAYLNYKSYDRDYALEHIKKYVKNFKSYLNIKLVNFIKEKKLNY